MDMDMHKLETLTEALAQARADGYTCSYEADERGLVCQETGAGVGAADLQIVYHQRFEGPSSEDDKSVLYLVEKKDGSGKGVIIDAYGTYANDYLAEHLKQMPVEEAY